MSFFIDRNGSHSTEFEIPTLASPLTPRERHVSSDDGFSPVEIPSSSDSEEEVEDVTEGRHKLTNVVLPVPTERRLLAKQGQKRKSTNILPAPGKNTGRQYGDAMANLDTQGSFHVGQQTTQTQPRKDVANSPKKSKKRSKNKPKDASDDFPQTIEVPEEMKDTILKRDPIVRSHVRQARVKNALLRQEEDVAIATDKAARIGMLYTQDHGILEAEDGEDILSLDQDRLASSVDIASAEKRFELSLKKFGPYTARYSRNGKYLLIGGKLGHVAAFDWTRKSLECEMNVMETVNDICWLHNESMFAVGQRRWVHIYDRQGVELHAVRQLPHVTAMQFLPHHFLLATMNERGFLSYLDVSMGKMVSDVCTRLRGVRVMRQNPQTGVIYTAHPNGIVNFWAPNTEKTLGKLLCHKSAIATMAVDHTGNYLTTCGIDSRLKLFDLRVYKPVHSYKLSIPARSLDFSQRGLLAAGFPRSVDVFKDVCTRDQAARPYLTHRLPRTQIGNVEFCRYEDVLAIGHQLGVASILVPGSAEANFDAFEVNPFGSKKQRREAEVKMLLDKVQPELISLTPNAILKVTDHKPLLPVEQDKPTLKNKRKGKDKAEKRELRKKGVVEELKKEQFKQRLREDLLDKRRKGKRRSQKESRTQDFDPLSRFNAKVT